MHQLDFENQSSKAKLFRKLPRQVTIAKQELILFSSIKPNSCNRRLEMREIRLHRYKKIATLQHILFPITGEMLKKQLHKQNYKRQFNV